MMSRKTLSTWSIVMIIVFGGVVILYPLIFSSEHESTAPAAGAGVTNPPTMPVPPQAPPVQPVVK